MKVALLVLLGASLGGWWLWCRWRYADDERPLSDRWLRQQE